MTYDEHAQHFLDRVGQAMCPACTGGADPRYCTCEGPDWWDRLDELETCGDARAVEIYALTRDWVTCACGRQDPRLHELGGAPWDSELADLGIKFPSAIRRGVFLDCVLLPPEKRNLSGARNILIAIEKRSAELLGGMA